MSGKYFTYWDSVEHLATDFDVPYPRANAWTTRGYIPAKYDIKRADLIRAKGGEPAFESFAEERSTALSQA